MTLEINGLEVITVPVNKPGSDAAPYAGFGHAIVKFPAGYRKTTDSAPFQVATLFEKDLAVPMRDGVKLFCDVFRPTSTEKCPAIIIWSPYGKGGNGQCSPT